MEKGLHYPHSQKVDTSDFADFRPFTLKSFPLKICTSGLYDSIYACLQANPFIEHRVQKDFFLSYP